MRAYEFLTELRKNEKLGKKTKMKNNTFRDLESYKDDDSIFVSFQKDMGSQPKHKPSSRENVGYKLGLNPKSTFDTPLGIYCFPLKAAWHYYDIGSKGLEGFPSIIGGASYVSVFKSKVPVVDVLDLPNLYWDKVMEIADASFDEEELQNIKDDAREFMDSVTSFGDKDVRIFEIWNILRQLSLLKKVYSVGMPKHQTSNPVEWTKLFRQLGIMAVSDKTGVGVIHSNETCQAVFFANSVIEQVDVLDIKDKDETNIDKEQIFRVKNEVMRTGNWNLVLSLDSSDDWEPVFTDRSGRYREDMLFSFFNFLLSNKDHSDYLWKYFSVFDEDFPSNDVYAHILHNHDYDVLKRIPVKYWHRVFEESDNSLVYEYVKWFLSKDDYDGLSSFFDRVVKPLKQHLQMDAILQITKSKKINLLGKLFTCVATKSASEAEAFLSYFDFGSIGKFLTSIVEYGSKDLIKRVLEKHEDNIKDMLSHMIKTNSYALPKLLGYLLEKHRPKDLDNFFPTELEQSALFKYCLEPNNEGYTEYQHSNMVRYLYSNLPIFSNMLTPENVKAILNELEIPLFAKLLNLLPDEILASLGRGNTVSIQKLCSAVEKGIRIPQIFLDKISQSVYAIENIKLWPVLFKADDKADCDLLLSRILKLQSIKQDACLKNFVKQGYYVSRVLIRDNIENLNVNESESWMDLVSPEDTILCKMIFEAINNVRPMRNYIRSGYPIFGDIFAKKLEEFDDFWSLMDNPEKWQSMIGESPSMQKQFFSRIMGKNSKEPLGSKKRWLQSFIKCGFLTQEMADYLHVNYSDVNLK